MVGFVISVFLTPPDPFTQLFAALLVLLITLPFSYWLVYRRGLPDRLQF